MGKTLTEVTIELSKILRSFINDLNAVEWVKMDNFLPQTFTEVAIDLGKILRSFVNEQYSQEMKYNLTMKLMNYFGRWVYYGYLKQEDLNLIKCEFDFYSRAINIAGGKELTEKLIMNGAIKDE